VASPHYTRFLDMLAGISGDPVLFEPLLPTELAEQLIWRRGPHLWNRIASYLETMISLQERTHSDIAIADMRLFREKERQLADVITMQASNDIRFLAICDSPESYTAAASSLGICAVAVYHWQTWLDIVPAYSPPVIAMDGPCDAAVQAGLAGWFCPENAEFYWEKYHKKIAILGGLGTDWLREAQPTAIHARCERLFSLTAGSHFAIGSGGNLQKDAYLSLISLLGIYNRYR